MGQRLVSLRVLIFLLASAFVLTEATNARWLGQSVFVSSSEQEEGEKETAPDAQGPGGWEAKIQRRKGWVDKKVCSPWSKTAWAQVSGLRFLGLNNMSLLPQLTFRFLQRFNTIGCPLRN